MTAPSFMTGVRQVALINPATGAAYDASTPLPVGASLDPSLIGAVTETAPASDTASSGLNGRLQRIAQRLTTIIGGLVLAAGEAFIGRVGGTIDTASANFTRPADTNVYAATGDLVANNVTAGSVVPMTFAIARAADKSFMIRRARIKKSGTSLTNAQFRLHLYRQSPTPSNGDNGVWLTDEKNYLGSLDVTMDRAFTDAAKGIAVPNTGSEINGVPDSGTVNIYGLLEARAAYTPISGEVFTVTLESHLN